jgi:hypothetical protein
VGAGFELKLGASILLLELLGHAAFRFVESFCGEVAPQSPQWANPIVPPWTRGDFRGVPTLGLCLS